ncbi:MAG TPA: lysylphosphatidylglycerol synthase transmembrane domain-containing protein [Anaerolineae bacterium]|nr:lysylphosphatidylglycerol synthase transmembrane domain-containing protein [Anaerolineae bacterium]
MTVDVRLGTKDKAKQKRRAKLFNALKVVISVGMLAYVLFVRVDLGELAAVVADARWGYLAVAALLAILGVALRAVRWRAMLRAIEIDVHLRRLVGLYFVGTFFNIFLPSGFGGDAVRTMELARQSKRTPEAIGTVLVDRANGLWVLFILGLIALPLAAQHIPTDTVLLLGVISGAAVIGGWIVMGTAFLPWLGAKVKLPGQAKLERFYEAVSRCGRAALGQASAVSLLFNLMNITVNYLIARGLNVDRPFWIFFAFAPILSVSLLVPSIGGLGVRETAHMLMYGTVGVGDAAATAMGLAQFAVQTLVPGLIGGVMYAIEGMRGLRTHPEREVQE